MLGHIERAGFIPGPAQQAVPPRLQLLQLFLHYQFIQGTVNNSPSLFIRNEKQFRNLLIVIDLFGISSKYPHDQCGGLFAREFILTGPFTLPHNICISCTS